MQELYRGKDVPNLGQVGDVKQSILTETQFQDIHGPTWTLMDAKDVTGSKFHEITGNTTLPDGRGVFLRGKNNGRSDGNENPDGDVAEGTFQDDAAQRTIGQFDAAVRPDQGFVGPSGTVTQLDSHASFDSGPVNLGGGRTYKIDNSDGGVYKTSGTGNGDGENRSKNITVNYFVKIN